MTTKDLIGYLQRLYNDYYDVYLDGFKNKKFFLARSYARWAIKELIKILSSNEKISPLSVVEKFRHQMDTYACRKKITSCIFSTAYDVADDILNKLTSGE